MSKTFGALDALTKEQEQWQGHEHTVYDATDMALGRPSPLQADGHCTAYRTEVPSSIRSESGQASVKPRYVEDTSWRPRGSVSQPVNKRTVEGSKLFCHTIRIECAGASVRKRET